MTVVMQSDTVDDQCEGRMDLKVEVLLVMYKVGAQFVMMTAFLSLMLRVHLHTTMPIGLLLLAALAHEAFILEKIGIG